MEELDKRFEEELKKLASNSACSSTEATAPEHTSASWEDDSRSQPEEFPEQTESASKPKNRRASGEGDEPKLRRSTSKRDGTRRSVSLRKLKRDASTRGSDRSLISEDGMDQDTEGIKKRESTEQSKRKDRSSGKGKKRPSKGEIASESQEDEPRRRSTERSASGGLRRRSSSRRAVERSTSGTQKQRDRSRQPPERSISASGSGCLDPKTPLQRSNSASVSRRPTKSHTFTRSASGNGSKQVRALRERKRLEKTISGASLDLMVPEGASASARRSTRTVSPKRTGSRKAGDSELDGEEFETALRRESNRRGKRGSEEGRASGPPSRSSSRRTVTEDGLSSREGSKRDLWKDPPSRAGSSKSLLDSDEEEKGQSTRRGKGSRSRSTSRPRLLKPKSMGDAGDEESRPRRNPPSRSGSSKSILDSDEESYDKDSAAEPTRRGQRPSGAGSRSCSTSRPRMKKEASKRRMTSKDEWGEEVRLRKVPPSRSGSSKNILNSDEDENVSPAEPTRRGKAPPGVGARSRSTSRPRLNREGSKRRMPSKTRSSDDEVEEETMVRKKPPSRAGSSKSILESDEELVDTNTASDERNQKGGTRCLPSRTHSLVDDEEEETRPRRDRRKRETHSPERQPRRSRRNLLAGTDTDGEPIKKGSRRNLLAGNDTDGEPIRRGSRRNLLAGVSAGSTPTQSRLSRRNLLSGVDTAKDKSPVRRAGSRRNIFSNDDDDHDTEKNSLDTRGARGARGDKRGVLAKTRSQRFSTRNIMREQYTAAINRHKDVMDSESENEEPAEETKDEPEIESEVKDDEGFEEQQEKKSKQKSVFGLSNAMKVAKSVGKTAAHATVKTTQVAAAVAVKGTMKTTQVAVGGVKMATNSIAGPALKMAQPSGMYQLHSDDFDDLASLDFTTEDKEGSVIPSLLV